MKKIEVFRQGQGKTSRSVAIIFCGLIGVLLAKWVYSLLPIESALHNSFFRAEFIGISITWAHLISAAMFCLCFIAGLFLANNSKVATFLIDTESEIKKVAWPTTKELSGSTGVVIVATLSVAVFLGIADLIISRIMHLLINL